MGLFDFFKRGEGKASQTDGKPVDRKFAKLRKTVADKRAQTYDRDEAMDQLVGMGSPEAAGALLRRFDLKVDPSITDQEEKQRAFDRIVRIGRGQVGIRLEDIGKPPKEIDDSPLSAEEKQQLTEGVVKVTEQYCEGAENLSWALKVLRTLLDDDDYQQSLLRMLAKHDTEYARNIEPKVNLLGALEPFSNDTVRGVVEEYLQDVNETVRFHAVHNVFEQNNPASLSALVAMAEEEESVRIKNKVAAGLVERDWAIPTEQQQPLREALRDSKYTVDDGAGRVRAR